MEVEVTAGFLIVKTFERMYRDYLSSFEKYRQADSRVTYGPMPLEQMPGRYRGVARGPIEPWSERLRGTGLFDEPTDRELAASLFMTELRDAGKAQGFFIFALDDARKLFGMIAPPVEREIIWAGRMDRDHAPPLETVLLGYEPIDFGGDFSSVITGIAFFRYRAGADPDGKYAKILHATLNEWGLFHTPNDAQEYVDTFPLRELPEHERPRHIAEVRGGYGVTS